MVVVSVDGDESGWQLVSGRTFMYDTFEPCRSTSALAQHTLRRESSRMTEKSRLDTAAAAIVSRIMILNKPRVLLLELPCRRGSRRAIMAKEERQRESDEGSQELFMKMVEQYPGGPTVGLVSSCLHDSVLATRSFSRSAEAYIIKGAPMSRGPYLYSHTLHEELSAERQSLMVMFRIEYE
jgi:hypothetical protein